MLLEIEDIFTSVLLGSDWIMAFYIEILMNFLFVYHNSRIKWLRWGITTECAQLYLINCQELRSFTDNSLSLHLASLSLFVMSKRNHMTTFSLDAISLVLFGLIFQGRIRFIEMLGHGMLIWIGWFSTAMGDCSNILFTGFP